MQENVKPITLAGLFLSLFGVLIVIAVQRLPLLTNTLPEQNLAIFGLFLMWLVTVLLLIIIKLGEKKSFDSIGFTSITAKETLLAVGIGIVLSLAVPVLTLLVSQIIPTDGGGIEEVTSNNAWWLLLASILTAGMTEEILFRGYIIERVQAITNKKAIAIIVSIIAFVLPHTFSWNMAHVVGVVLPMGLILSGIYLWKRNLIFNVIIHIVIDLPLVVMALMAG